MDADQHALAAHLMAEISARLEEAHDLSVAGQAPGGDPAGRRRIATRTCALLDEIGSLCDAVVVLCRPDGPHA